MRLIFLKYRYRLLISFLIFFIVFYLINNFNPSISYSLRLSSLELTKPLFKRSSQLIISANKFINNFKNYLDAANQNKILKEQNEILEEYFFRLRQVIAENSSLKKLLNYQNSESLSLITAQVIAKSNNPFLQYIYIDQGSKNNVHRGQLVIYKTNLVGRVIEVFPSTAKIILITDLNFKFPVKSIDSGEQFVVQGLAKNYLGCKYLGESVNLKEEELIYTENTERLNEAKILLGKIIKKDDKFFVLPLVNLANLDFVQVINNNND